MMVKRGLVLIASLAGIAAAPASTGSYVALGSSYAAGFGLGPVLADTPAICARTSNGYPQQVARDLGLTLVDASCGGATVEQIVATGQGGLAPQIEAVRSDAMLVTITAGGNDVEYVGGMFRAARHDAAKPAGSDAQRFALLRTRLRMMFAGIRQRAPNARIVIVTYPTVLPRRGTCDALGLTAAQAVTSRAIADRLAALTRETARGAHAEVVDMASVSEGHDVCSAAPWTNGATPRVGAPFHPNLAGTTATAKALEALLARPATQPRHPHAA